MELNKKIFGALFAMIAIGPVTGFKIGGQIGNVYCTLSSFEVNKNASCESQLNILVSTMFNVDPTNGNYARPCGSIDSTFVGTGTTCNPTTATKFDRLGI
jgi:hypothetical protein